MRFTNEQCPTNRVTYTNARAKSDLRPLRRSDECPGRRRVGARGGGRGELQMLHPEGAVERGAPPVLGGWRKLCCADAADRVRTRLTIPVWSGGSHQPLPGAPPWRLNREHVWSWVRSKAACSPPDLKTPSPTRRRLPSERAVVRRTAAMRSAPLPCRLYALVPLLSVRTSAQLAVSPSREFVPHRGMRISPEITRHNVE